MSTINTSLFYTAFPSSPLYVIFLTRCCISNWSGLKNQAFSYVSSFCFGCPLLFVWGMISNQIFLAEVDAAAFCFMRILGHASSAFFIDLKYVDLWLNPPSEILLQHQKLMALIDLGCSFSVFFCNLAFTIVLLITFFFLL